MQNHVFVPIPDIQKEPQPTNKEERLKAIISNLERQQQDVRANIIAQGHLKLGELRHRDGAHSALEMEDLQVGGSDSANSNLLVSNLNAPYEEGSGDPCVSPNAVLPVDSNVPQMPLPPEMKVYQETMEQLEVYDKHSKQAKDYYIKILGKQKATGRNIERSSTDLRKGEVHDSGDPRRRSMG